MLRKVSEAMSMVHTAFLAPPVSKCLTSECKGAALSKPHPPNTVTIFTVSGGPLPALKCNLRCSKCGTIHNYSMYRNKKKGVKKHASMWKLVMWFIASGNYICFTVY